MLSLTKQLGTNMIGLTKPLREATLEDIKELMSDQGYLNLDDDFAFTEEHDFFKYNGYSDTYGHQHKFLIGCEDVDNEYFYATYIYVSLNRAGLLEADYASMPHEQFDTFEELEDYISKQCN